MSYVVKIGVLFKKLTSIEVMQLLSQKRIHADLEKWKEILVKIEAVLADAEEKQTTNRLVEIWLDDLKNLVYDVEDMLDEFATEALQRKLMDEPQASTGFNVCKFILTCCTHLSPRSLKLNYAMATQIEEIDTRFQEIVKTTYGLIQVSGAGSKRAKYQTLQPATTSSNEPHIYGRDNDKAKLLDMLLKDEGIHAKFSVISIEGMGGLGKTTLAQLVYNDAKVEHHFQIKAWIHVSNDFNLIQVMKTILQSITDETSNVNDLNMLHVKLKEKMSGQKFFIVLDDVWVEENEDYNNWTKLCLPFEDCSEGSKIIVTTRHHSVSQQVRARAYQLKELSNNDCLSMFTQHSLGKKDFSEHKYLEEIGEKIIGKCAGLPLAAKTLGGLLRDKLDCKQWEEVLESNILNLPQKKTSGLLSALKVSYYYLPSDLKQCFAYCSIFPKRHEFRKEDLILLWMAEGFLQTENTQKEIEDLGEEYFDDLHSRSFFQQSINDASSFVMHDLINDLAQWAAQDFCFRIENLQEGVKQLKIPNKLRHLSYDGSNYNCIKESGPLNAMKGVRTFLTLPPNSQLDFLYEFLDIVLQPRNLRVLSLKRYPFDKLPDSVGDMKLLHHLDLSFGRIEFLPDSINTLYNLEALTLEGCYRLTSLGSDMGNLIKLRHLNVFGVDRLKEMPSRIGKLTGLRRLDRFVVGKDRGSGLRELKDLTQLRERLQISGLENVNDLGDADMANLNSKGGLKDIRLEWTSSNDVSNAAQVLEKLRPCQKLESLQIQGYGGAQFPQWLDDVEASPHLRKLLIEDGEQWKVSVPRLPEDCTIQIAKCKEVVLSSIKDCSSLSSKLSSIAQNLTRLEKLTLSDCPKLKDFPNDGLPRSLKKLEMRNCPAMVSIPEGGFPTSLTSLVILNTNICKSLFERGLHRLHSLEELEISGGCPDVKSFPQQEIDMILPVSLKSLYICDFPNLEKLSSIAQNLTRLEKLTLSDCPKLKDFPNDGFPRSLKKLEMRNCPAMVSIPEGGFPTSLTSLVIEVTNICNSLSEWGLHGLNSLEVLTLNGGCPGVMSFPQEEIGMILPVSLKSLHILAFPNLERLSSIVQKLTCLEKLTLSDCPKLEYFPDYGLPKSLKKLRIIDCPLLEERCKEGGDYRKMIHHLTLDITEVTDSD